MTEPLRYRYYVRYQDRNGDCEVDNVWARNADEALAAWAQGHLGRGVELFRKVELNPVWDAVLLPSGVPVLRADWEARQAGARQERTLYGGALPTSAQTERDAIEEAAE